MEYHGAGSRYDKIGSYCSGHEILLAFHFQIIQLLSVTVRGLLNREDIILRN